jgi:hypothetical protein
MRKSRRANIDAMLRHLASHQAPQDFPGTAYERAALIEAAGKRRLVEWRQDRRRFELTRAGERRLRRGPFGSLAIGAAIAATIGAVALAAFWRPADRSTGEIAAPRSNAQNVGAPTPAVSPPAAATPASPSTVAADAAPGATPGDPVAPATAAESPGATPPEGEASATGAKEPGERKSSRRTAPTPRHWNWTAAHRYRDERFSGTVGR